MNVISPPVALPAVEIWREMRLHLEWSEGLVLVVLFAESSAALAPLRQWTGDTWQAGTVPVRFLSPDNAAQAVAQVLGGLEAEAHVTPDLRAPVWVELLAHTTPTQAWDAVRALCLARLNEAREWLTNTFKRPLVICLPTAWLAQIGALAPDLWHVRSYVATVLSQPASKRMGPSFSALDLTSGGLLGMGSSELRCTSAADSSDFLITSLRSVADTAESASLQQPGPGALRQLWKAKSDLSHALLQAGLFSSALQEAAQALALMRQLRQTLGDRHAVLRDLVVALNTLGDAEQRAGRIDHALAAYREGLELCRMLRKSFGDSPDMQDLLLASLVKFGDVQRDAGQPEAALQSYQAELALRRQQYGVPGATPQTPQTPQTPRGLAVLLIAIGDVEHDAGHDQAALAAYSEALELLRQQRQVLGDSPQRLDDLAVSLERLARSAALPLPQRQAMITEALSLRQQLGAALPRSDYHRARLSVAQEIANPLLGGEPG